MSEQLLWIAVINQAFHEARLPTRKYDAEHWLTTDSKGFRDVCELAGMDHEWVRELYLRIRNIRTAPKTQPKIKDFRGSAVSRYDIFL